MSETKECISCFSEIDARAKRCPNCRSLQTKYSNLENNPIIIGILAVFIIMIFGYLSYEIVFARTLEDEAIKELVIDVREISTKSQGNDLYVACLGSIENNSDFKFKDVKLEVSFFSQNGEVVDTFSGKDKEITIVANDVTNFRVRGIAQKEAGLYTECVVKVVDAWAR